MTQNKKTNGWGATGMLWWREVLRFYRQPSRVAAAILSPLLFWFLIGSGVGSTFSKDGTHYLEYFFSGSDFAGDFICRCVLDDFDY